MIARNRRFCGIFLASLLALLTACASTKGPDIRVHSAPDVAFSSFGTFGFPDQTGTARGGYSTLITNYFKNAVRKQMELRGYRYVDANPDLLVNFYANARERTEIRTMPSMGYGYYGYRYGLYNAWPLYDNEIDSVTYPVGTANIDIVDAKRKQMIWEGVAQGRITTEDMKQPQAAIDRVVAQLFQRFPGTASGVENALAGD